MKEQLCSSLKNKGRKADGSSRPICLPTMTRDYSKISATARAVTIKFLPRIKSYLKALAPQIAALPAGSVWAMADYGSADGVNSSALFEQIIELIRSINPSLKIQLFYIDLAEPAGFDRFWAGSALSRLEGVKAEYLRRSFYESFPEISGKLQLGFSSTAMHWLDTKNAEAELFQHPSQIQANQLPKQEARKFAKKWQTDWRGFFRERYCELIKGGALFLADLTCLGDEQWPASAGYNFLRDICLELYQEGRISATELNAVFVPDYFATPREMESLLNAKDLRAAFALKSCEALTIPCAYFAGLRNRLKAPRTELAATLAKVVRAWSESSLKAGLSSSAPEQIAEIYRRLEHKFAQTPQGLPYQYCLLELLKR